MAVAKFNWHGTNPNKTFQTRNPPVVAWPEMIIFNATKEENEAAYQALVNRGPVSKFKTKVWNDICAKVYDICDDWNINEQYRNAVAWNPFIHDPDREKWRALAKKNWPSMLDYEIEEWIDSVWQRYRPGTFTSWDYNALYSLWLAPLGLSDFTVKKGDEIKAEYILRLVEVINHWTELRPLDVRFTTDMRWNARANGVLVPSLPMLPVILAISLQVANKIALCPRVLCQIWDNMKLDLNPVEVPVLSSLACSSLMNFMTLNVNCKVWDKEILYVVPEELSGRYEGKARLDRSTPFPFVSSDQFKFGQKVPLKTSADLQAMFPLFFFEIGGSVKSQLWNPYSVKVSDSFSYSGSAKLRRTARPIPMSALTGFAFQAKARVDFEGIHMLDMAPGRIVVQEQINPDIRAARMLEHEQQIPVSSHKQGMTVVQAATLLPESDQIVLRDEPEELQDAGIVWNKHKGKVKVEQKIQLLNHSPDAMSHTGVVQKMEGGGELTFANEESLDVRAGSFHVGDETIELAFQKTQVMMHDGCLDTKEQISISEDPPLPIEGEAEIRSVSSGVLDREQVLEHAADAVIETASYAEILSGLNKVLETEMVAARTSSVAAMYVRRYFHLAAEEELSSREYGILDKRIRKLMESSNTTATKEKGVLLLRLIRFASGSEKAETFSEAEVVRTLPRHAASTENTVATGLSAFLDASYVRGDSLISAPDISVFTEAEVGVSAAGSPLTAKGTVTAAYESELEKTASKTLFGGEIAKTGAEAKLMMARTKKILALEYEDTLVTELEEMNAADVERHLLFS